MGVFSLPFLFLRNPRGGVEDLAAMKAAGFQGVFCNIGDHTPAEWEHTVRSRALAAGMFCGPWARTQAPDGGFSEIVLSAIVQCAARWQSPLIVNSEAELKGSGKEITTLIAEAVEGFDAALSMEPQPFANVEWWPLKAVPVLPQVFGHEWAVELKWVVDQWHAYGVDCVFPTFGAYNGTPQDYDLNAPYSIYTADDMAGNYDAWTPRRSDYQGCVETPPPIPEDLMEKIGTQDGINGFMDWLRSQPGVKPRGSGYKENDIATWPMSDKIERTLRILVKDHDAQADG